MNGQPVWGIVFYCMRCGDLEAARSALNDNLLVFIMYMWLLVLCALIFSEIAQYLEEYQNTQDFRYYVSTCYCVR